MKSFYLFFSFFISFVSLSEEVPQLKTFSQDEVNLLTNEEKYSKKVLVKVRPFKLQVKINEKIIFKSSLRLGCDKKDGSEKILTELSMQTPNKISEKQLKSFSRLIEDIESKDKNEEDLGKKYEYIYELSFNRSHEIEEELEVDVGNCFAEILYYVKSNEEENEVGIHFIGTLRTDSSININQSLNKNADVANLLKTTFEKKLVPNDL